jgi:hypothetical protein
VPVPPAGMANVYRYACRKGVVKACSGP